MHAARQKGDASLKHPRQVHPMSNPFRGSCKHFHVLAIVRVTHLASSMFIKVSSVETHLYLALGVDRSKMLVQLKSNQ